MTTTLPDTVAKRTSLIAYFADKYGIESNRMLETLKQTCFKTERGITNEQMASLLLVCKANDLNPFVRMLHALLDKQGNVVPFVGIDGWISLVNRRPEFDGVELDVKADGSECTCTMYRKDRSHPTRITEYLSETKRGSTPWATSPRRMLRHRAYAQCARVAFGFPGLHDEYDARIIARDDDGDAATAVDWTPPRPPNKPSTAARVREVLSEPAPAVAAVDVSDMPEWPDSEPPEGVPRTLQEWVEEMLRMDDQEAAALVVDEARGLPIHAELSAAYRAKWTPKE